MGSSIKIIENDGICVVLNTNTGAWFVANETGKIVTEAVLNGTEEEEIIDQLVTLYELPRQLIKNDISSAYRVITKKLDDISKSEIEHMKSEDNKGSSITIHITGLCNLHCSYCYREASNTDGNELSIDDIVKTIRDFFELGYLEFVISGGEPTLYKEFSKLVIRLKELKNQYSKLKLTLVTNGTTQLSQETIQLMCSCFSSIQVSLDSCNENINKITRGEGSLRKVSEFIGRLREQHYEEIYLLATPYILNSSNYNPIIELPDLLKYAIKHETKGFKVNQIRPNGRLKLDKFSEFNNELYWQGVDEVYDEMGRQYHNNGVGKYSDFKLAISHDMNQILLGECQCEHCGIGISTLAIDQFGDVYPCTSLMDKEFLMGNILVHKIADIVSYGKDEYGKRTVDTIESCKECEFRKLCGGGCRAMAYYINNDLYGENPLCLVYKKRLNKWFNQSLNIAPALEEVDVTQ